MKMMVIRRRQLFIIVLINIYLFPEKINIKSFLRLNNFIDYAFKVRTIFDYLF
jgi:hypothetical protein